MSKLEKISNLNRNVSSGPLPVSTDLATVGQVDVAGLYANSIQPMAASKVKVDTTSAAAESVNTAAEAPLLSATIVIVGDKVSGAANDVLHGTDGEDSIYGGNGSDTLYGYGGYDTLSGGSGVDFLYGGDGGDVLIGGTGNDFLFGTDNEYTYLSDTADFSDHFGSVSKGWNINLVTQVAKTTDSVNGSSIVETDTLSQIYSAIGSSGNDTFTVGNGHSVYGGAGTDTLILSTRVNEYGEITQDTITTGIYGGENIGRWEQGWFSTAFNGIEIYRMGDGVDRFAGGDGADIVYGEADFDFINGGGNNDKIFGGEGSDLFRGDGGNDLVNGGAGDDNIDGGVGRDTLVGGAGADIFFFGAPANTLTNADTISDFVHLVDDLQLLYQSFVSLNGSVEASELRIGTAALDGNDYLVYDQARGKLYYDADGNGSIAKELVVTLTKNTLLTVDDFTFL